jgi:hypothetical protein
VHVILQLLQLFKHRFAAWNVLFCLPLLLQIGDYYDTLLFPFYTPTAPDALTLRFQPGVFTGYSVLHCQ